MATPDYITLLQKEIAYKLNILNDNYLDSYNKSPFFGSSVFFSPDDSQIFQKPQSTTLTFGNYMNRLFSTYGSTGGVPGTLDAPDAGSTSDTSRLYYSTYSKDPSRPNDNVYIMSGPRAVSWSGLSAAVSANEGIRDINCMWYYKSNTSTFTFMQGLYAWYNLLEPATWSKFTNNIVTNIMVPDVSGGNLVYTQCSLLLNSDGTIAVSGTALSTGATGSGTSGGIAPAMNSIASITDILQYPDFNVYVARRLFYLYIQIGQYYMAMGILSVPALQSNADVKKIVDSVVGILANANYVATSQDGIANTLAGKTQDRVKNYIAMTSNIDQLNNAVSTGQTQLTTNQQKLSKEQQNTAKVKKYELAAMSMMIIVVILSTMLVVAPLEYSQKLSYALGIVMFAVLSSFTITALFNRAGIPTFEAFSGSSVASVSGKISGTSYSGYTDVVIAANNYFYGQVSDYLTNTINLTNTLQTFSIYGNVNYSLEREQSYYQDTKDGLDVVNNKINSIYKISFLDQVQTTALMNFFLSVTIIAAATIIGYVALQEYLPALAKVWLGIGIFLIVVSLIIYVLEVSRRVRTDGDKIYWSHPSSNVTNML